MHLEVFAPFFFFQFKAICSSISLSLTPSFAFLSFVVSFTVKD